MQESKEKDIGNHFLYPSNLFFSNKEFDVQTILGSCIAVCIYDPILKQGGINHYMVPMWNGSGLESPKYGNIAIEMLINKMLAAGSNKCNLQSKIFGGASQFDYSNNILNVGEKNILIAQTILQNHNIKITGSSLGGSLGRKIIFNTFSGQVMMKYILKSEK